MPRYAIDFANRQYLVRINRLGLRRLARSLLTRELVEFAEISVALVDDSQIQSINRQFLKHDFPTDVISFPFSDGDMADNHAALKSRKRTPTRHRLDGHADRRASATNRRGSGKVISAEIVISAETAMRAANECHTNPEYELALYLVHGLLHLCGYDDTSTSEKRLMRRREAEALRAWQRAEV